MEEYNFVSNILEILEMAKNGELETELNFIFSDDNKVEELTPFGINGILVKMSSGSQFEIKIRQVD